jgi:hypothetical protein
MRARPTKEQVKQRTNEIVRILLDGAESWDIEEYVREQEADADSPWHIGAPISYCQIRRYVQRAERQIAKASSKENRGRLIHRHLARRRSLYAKAVAQGDIRAALAVLDSEAKLLGLFPQAQERKDAPNVHVNIFDRIATIHEQLKSNGHGRLLESGVAGGDLPGDGGTKPLDTAVSPPHGEAEAVSNGG